MNHYSLVSGKNKFCRSDISQIEGYFLFMISFLRVYFYQALIKKND